MNLKPLSVWLLTTTAAILLLAVPSAHAQGRGPGGGRPGPGMTGGRPGPGFGAPTMGHDGGRSNIPAGNSSRGDTGNVTHGNIKLGPAGRWWDNANVAHSVGLRKDQQKRMDSIFKSNKPALLESYATLEREETKLATISKQAQPDKTQLFAAIDSVNQARASLEKVRTQMLLQMREQMDAEQITRMEALE